MEWELLTPRDFEKLAREEQVCIIPMGSLERHGEHLPFGTDTLLAHKVAIEATKIEPCVVFPTYYFAQIHEASCYTGAIALPSRLTLELLETVCDQIAQNGFKKIVVLNGHGGNNAFLQYFAMSNLDRKVDYSLYIVPLFSSDLEEKENDEINKICGNEYGHGHADVIETSLIMSAHPETVKLEYSNYKEPIEELNRTKHLGRIYTGLWWYGDVPENVQGSPSEATKEKGDALLEIYVKKFAKELKLIKMDDSVPTLQQEFYKRVDSVKIHKYREMR